MNELSVVLLAILGFFIVLLLIQKGIQRKFCALCGAVILSWGTLLILHYLNVFQNLVLIALLMGQSVVGIYYWAEKRARKWQIFRVPFLLTLLLIAYVFISPRSISSGNILIISILWIFFALLRVYNENRPANRWAKRIVSCCKRW